MRIDFGNVLTFDAKNGAVIGKNGKILIDRWEVVCQTAECKAELRRLSFEVRCKGAHWIGFAKVVVQGLNVFVAISGGSRKRLRVRVSVCAKQDVEILLLAIDLKSRLPPIALLGANRRLMKCSKVAAVVWLEKQGAYFGKGDASFFVQHVPGISSLSLRQKGHSLRFSLFSSKDRPLPRRDKTFLMGYRLDNPVRLSRGKNFIARWNLYAGFLPREIALPGFAPDGRKAVHIWTEHGCQTVLEAHIASGLGSSRARRAEDAVGGFVKFQVPLTKTIFVDNEDDESVFDPFGKLGQRPQLSMNQDAKFEDYLGILSSQPQIEIGLHCCRPYSTSPDEYPRRLERFLKFKPAVWIDHIWFRDDGHMSGCREAASSEGRDRKSDYFSTEVLAALGFRYFWSNGFEYRDAEPTGTLIKNYLRHKQYFAAAISLGRWLFNRVRGRLANVPVPSIPDLPRRAWPLYWVDEVKEGNSAEGYEAVYWTTASTNYPVVEGTSPVPPGSAVYGAASIDELIERESVCITHAYPSSSHGRGSYWEESNGEFRATPHFNALLLHMSRRAEEGALWNAKLSDAIAFWRRCEDIRVDYSDDGAALIYSVGAPINNLTVKFYDLASSRPEPRYKVISILHKKTAVP